jgi:four helix bundle protein
MQNFRDLKVWPKAHELALATYRATTSFPGDERYGLTQQVRRGVVSIGSNIAEGCGRGSDADFARFLQMAMGSASEVEYQFLLAQDLGFLAPANHEDLNGRVVEVKRMLAALIATVKADS